jgi:cell division protein FtsW (lipid II flippase)
MWQVLALSLTLVGVVMVYMTNKHQRYRQHPLHARWRIVGYFFWLLSLFSWWQMLVSSAAFFTWLFVLLTVLTCVPLLSLLGSNKQQKRRRYE